MGGICRSFYFLALVALLVCGSLPVVNAQCGTSRRRSWRSLSCRERIQYLDAVQALKDRGIYDEFVYIHWDSGDWAHFVPEFLPWHRWYLWLFEKELQRVSGTCITVPFWDWERGDSLPIMLKSWTFGRRHREGCVRDGIARDWDPAEPGQRCLWREFDTDWEISRDVEVLSRITNLRDFDDFAESLEGAPHAGVHEFIGGPMSINWSPEDPLFWLHHSSVDRIWTLWQDYRDHDRIRDPRDFRWRHFSSDLDRPLVVVDQGRRRIDFNRPGRNRPPTPRELLINVDNRDTFIDVQYVNDTLTRLLLETSSRFRNGGNNPDWISPAQGRVRDVCPDGPWEEEEPEQEEEGQEQQEEELEEEPIEEQPVCGEIGDGCDNVEDCCSGFCSPFSGTCAQPCFRRGSQCDNDEECCSKICNRFGRCEDTFASVQLNTAQCLEIGSSCDRNGDCCTEHCSSRRGVCSMMCLDRGSRCNNSEECCSGYCNRFGRCEGNNLRRFMAAMDVEIKDEPLEFSAPRLKTRWYDLIAAYPDNPARLWEILAKEDCAERAALAGHDILSASQEWIDTMFKGNNTRVFDCHYTRRPF